MRVVNALFIFVACIWLPGVISEQQALFIKTDAFQNGKRVTRQTSADQMVQNILQWLQGVYTQNSRRVRQGSFREYLPPPSNTQKPRPFGYPPAGIQPEPPFTLPPKPGQGQEIGIPDQKPQYPPSSTARPEYTPFPTQGSTGSQFDGYPTSRPFEGYPSTRPSEGFPTSRPTEGYPTSRPSDGYPSSEPSESYSTTKPSEGYPTSRPSEGYSTSRPSEGYPTSRPSEGYPTSGPSGGYPTSGPSGGYPTTQPAEGYPTFQPSEGFSTQRPTGYPTQTGYPERPSTGYPTQPPSGYQTEQPSERYPTESQTGYPSQKPGYPQPDFQPTGSQPNGEYSTYQPDRETPGQLSTSKPGYPTNIPTGYPSSPGSAQTFPTQPPPAFTTQKPYFPSSTYLPSTGPSQQPAYTVTVPEIQESTKETEKPEISNEIPSEKPDSKPSGTVNEDDLSHPPHIHDINVECAKDMMTINIEFNRQFDGVIYSKGYYNNPECQYVRENSGQTKYKFTVSLNSCGTEFINGFDTEGKSYLENVLVLQNEPGIQEVWDTVRSVRCLWEGNLNKALSVALSVGMLNQEIVTFSGDTAAARLDILLGKGPFGQPANGLVKIGETMTLAVSVSGDPGFDIQVKDCRAKDSTGDHVVALTDDNGCILKPKLFGAFQKTRNTGNTGASIIAYAYFNAFKFPDVMDLMLECNVELCKTDCQMCTNLDQRIDPGRRRKRDVQTYKNETLGDAVTMGKMLRVILPEDLSDGKTIINLAQSDGVCLSTQSFVFSSALLISLLTFSCLFSAYLWLKNQHLTLKM